VGSHHQLKPCAVAGCPEVGTATKCAKHRSPHRNGSRDVRVTGRRWASIRRAVIREEPLCQLGLAGCTQFSEEVDHIIALSGGGHPTDRANLQAVCHSCHVLKTRMDMGQAPQ